MTDAAVLGTDLRVVLGPPGMAAYDAAALDLRSRPRPLQRATPRPGFAAAAVPAPPTGPQGWHPEPPGATELADIDTITGRENVAQALMLRLLTPKGSLVDLGHAGYGSRLGELVGKGKTDALRGLCRAYILEAVREEPRVDTRPLAITFDPAREQPWDFVVEITVQPVSGGDPITLGLEVGL
jgi:phage baseplate assembly protein W